MSAFDDILNVGIPILLVIIVLGFLWVKMIRPWVVPIILSMWERFSNRPQTETKYGKDIVYE